MALSHFVTIQQITKQSGSPPLLVLSFRSVQFSSVQSLSRVRLFATPWIAARQASLSVTNSRSSLRLRSIESVMPSSHLILCLPLLLLPPIPPSIRVFSNESTLRMRWPKYWSFSFSISPSKEGLITCIVLRIWKHEIPPSQRSLQLISLASNSLTHQKNHIHVPLILASCQISIVVVQSTTEHCCCCVQLFAIPWTAAHQSSLSFTISWSLLKLMSIESMMLSNHLILLRPLLLMPQSFPASGSFLVSWLFASVGQVLKLQI